MIHRGGRRRRAAAAVCVLLLAVLVVPASATAPRLAILIAAPWAGERAMTDDVRALATALGTRGFAGDQVVVADGVATRQRLLAVVADAARRIASWDRGVVFLAVSGHGTFVGSSAAEARVGLLLADGPEREVYWDEIFAALRVPAGVRVILLPDTCHTDLLAGRVPPNVAAILMKADAGAELACRARNMAVGDGQRGVIAYYAARSLPDAPTLGLWLEMIEADVAADRAADRLSAFHEPSLQLVGDPATPVPSASGTWYVMSRSEGCVDLSVLARGDRLARAPISPDDYADMMRARGHRPTLGLPPGFPSVMAGKVVMVEVRPEHAPVFVHEDICKQVEERR